MQKSVPFLPVLLLSAPLVGAQSVVSGYTIEEVADVPGVYALAFAPAGSVYGTDLFAATIDFGQVVSDGIARVSPSGVVTPFATLVPDADPVSLEFPPPGSPYGDLLYVSANNRDFGQPGDCGGVVQVVDPLGNWSDFTTLAGCVACYSSSAPGAGLGEPATLAFPAGGAYGWELLVTNMVDEPGSIMRVDLSGATSIFADDGLSSCTLDPGLQAPFSSAFGPGGAFGTELYVGDLDPACPCIRIVDPTGTVSAPFASLPAGPLGLRFGPGTPFDGFGGALFVCTTTEVYRVLPDGSYTVFATGFTRLANDPLEFATDGRSLYLADYGVGKVYRVRPTVRLHRRIGSPVLR